MADYVEYWLDLADYDLGAAKGMLKSKHWLYVGFMCHQVIEKALKAVISQDGNLPPRIHHLMRLADKGGLLLKMTEAQKDTLRKLNPLNNEARYPEQKEQIASALTAKVCQEIMKETEGLLCWIKEQLGPQSSDTPNA
jgi:HEPN domain-containing protein